MSKGAHDHLRKQLREMLTSRGAAEKRSQRRVRLELEELETRALLSASVAGDVTLQPNLTVTPAKSAAFTGYTPAQIQTAYGVPSSINGQLPGTGQTIAIVDAYNDPNIQGDLAKFDTKYSLAPANLTVINQSGGTSLPTANASWAVEESLDVEWAHAMAPGANIVLVEANSNSLSDLMTAVKTAASYSNPTVGTVSVVSMSWGGSEFSGETAYDSYFQPFSAGNPNGYTNSNVTFLASAGDSSALFGPEWPASSPNVLAVGGTTLKLTSSNTISSETAWSTTYSWQYGYEGGGGGVSSMESATAPQASATGYSKRATPDVSFDANPSTGVAIYDSYHEPGSGYVGGTSVGAPSWAGIVADADQQAVANGNPVLSTAQVDTTLYGAYQSGAYGSDFRDITSGNNGYKATTGYDLATGLGSPKVSALVALLGNDPPASPAALPPAISPPPPPPPPSGHRHFADVAVVLVTDGSSNSSVVIVSSTTPSAPIGVALAAPVASPVSAGAGVVSPLSLALPLPSASLPAILSSNGAVSGDLSGASASSPTTVFGASGWKGAAGSMQLSSFGLNAALVDRLAGELAGNPSEEEDSQSGDVPSAAAVFSDGQDGAPDAAAPEVVEGDAGAGDE